MRPGSKIQQLRVSMIKAYDTSKIPELVERLNKGEMYYQDIADLLDIHKKK